jgi:hypothetical protein
METDVIQWRHAPGYPGYKEWECRRCGLWHLNKEHSYVKGCPSLQALKRAMTPQLTKPKEEDMQNFRYQVIHRAPKTLEDATTGNTPKVTELIPPTDMMAASDLHVRMVAARKIPDEYADKLEQVEIIVKVGL